MLSTALCCHLVFWFEIVLKVCLPPFSFSPWAFILGFQKTGIFQTAAALQVFIGVMVVPMTALSMRSLHIYMFSLVFPRECSICSHSHCGLVFSFYFLCVCVHVPKHCSVSAALRGLRSFFTWTFCLLHTTPESCAWCVYLIPYCFPLFLHLSSFSNWLPSPPKKIWFAPGTQPIRAPSMVDCRSALIFLWKLTIQIFESSLRLCMIYQRSMHSQQLSISNMNSGRHRRWVCNGVSRWQIYSQWKSLVKLWFALADVSEHCGCQVIPCNTEWWDWFAVFA